MAGSAGEEDQQQHGGYSVVGGVVDARQGNCNGGQEQEPDLGTEEATVVEASGDSKPRVAAVQV